MRLRSSLRGMCRRDAVARSAHRSAPLVARSRRAFERRRAIACGPPDIPYPAALPILLQHLQQRGYPDRVMESLGRALAVKPSRDAWYTLRRFFLAADGSGEEEGLAVALAASATADQLDSLIDLLHETSRGSTRIHFLRPIKGVGGNRGIEVLSLKQDPLFGKEAHALLKRRAR